MLEQLRHALVKSYVGAIALGWIFAQAILHFAFMFSTPVASWLMRREYGPFMNRPQLPTGFSLQDALPELIKCLALFLIGYLLLRWLYFKPLREETSALPSQDASAPAG